MRRMNIKICKIHIAVYSDNLCESIFIAFLCRNYKYISSSCFVLFKKVMKL